MRWTRPVPHRWWRCTTLGPPGWAGAISRIGPGWCSQTPKSCDKSWRWWPRPTISRTGRSPKRPGKVAFIYPGKLFTGVAETLYRSEPVAVAVLDRCADLAREQWGRSLLDVLFGRSAIDGNPDDPAPVEAAVYALGCAMTALWESVGVRPAAVAGRPEPLPRRRRPGRFPPKTDCDWLWPSAPARSARRRNLRYGER